MTNYFTDEYFDWNSEVVDSLYYDRDTETLFVDFCSGAVRAYYGVSLDTWTEFLAAESKGRFYNREIKGNYRSEDVGYDFAEREVDANVLPSETADIPVVQVDPTDLVSVPKVQTFTFDTPEAKDEHGYTITFVTNGIEGQFNTDATSDEAAANEWRTLMDRLGLVATSAKVERDLV